MAQRKQRLRVEEIHGAWVIIPTPATPTADDWR
jgi:trans-o-hydroxybenzylidenepyruvate hydratase-aldolase